MGFSLFDVALKNLKRKSFRTAILIISIGLLVSILVFGTSFILSVSSTLKRASDRLGADLLIVPVGARDAAQEVLLETSAKTFYMDRSIIERLKLIKGIEEITYQTYLTTIMGVCCDIPSVKVVAFNQDTDFVVTPWLKKAINRRLNIGEAIVGYEANQNFDLLDMDTKMLFGNKFKIVGVLEKTGTGLDNAIFIDEENMADVIKNGKSGVLPNQISLIFTRVKKGLDPYQVGRDVEGEMVDVDVVTRNDIGKNILGTLKDINSIFIITIVLASLLSIFLAWAVFSAIVNERYKEIGIMRAIGASGTHIALMYLMEVVLLGIIGSLFGVALGTYLSVSLSGVFSLLRETAAYLTVYQRIEIGLFGLCVGVGVCVIGALSSIVRIKRLEPSSAIKEI